MREVVGDLWSYLPDAWVVVPTNLGWTKDYKNIMGAGVAKEAATRFPELPDMYGQYCYQYSSDPRVLMYNIRGNRIVCFPTKELNVETPHLSWRQKSSLELVERSAYQLAGMAEGHRQKVALPLVGCGMGGLRESDVIPVLQNHLADDKFVLVRQK